MRRRKKKRCFSLFAPVLPPPISLRKDTENSPSREPCRTTLLKRWPSFFLLRREIDSDGQSERAASEFFFALVSIGRFFSLFAFYLSLFLALGSSRGGARERDGVDGKREKRGRRKKQRGFFLLMLEEQKSKQSPTPLSTSHFSLLCSPPSLFTLSMRLKKRPRLLLCAPRRLAMPLHPAPAPLPPLSTAEEEEEGELRSEEEEDEGLPCADAAARVKKKKEKKTKPLRLPSAPLLLLPPASPPPAPPPPPKKKTKIQRQATPGERSSTSSASPSRRSPPPPRGSSSSSSSSSLKEKPRRLPPLLRRQLSPRPPSPPRRSPSATRSTPLRPRTLSGRSTTTSTGLSTGGSLGPRRRG